MGLFRRAKRSRGPSIVIDPCHYDADAQRLRAMLEQHDWKAAQGFLETVTDPDDRAFYLSICGDVPGLQDWIGQWIEAEPDATLPLLVRGAHAVYWAWEARGGARAAATSQEQFREFHQRLKVAENSLDQVVERNPGDAAAWAFLVTSARGRRVDRAEAQRRFDGAVRAHPGNTMAHEQMLQYLCNKWFGSRDEMFSFARTAVETAPPGSPLGGLVAYAHIEDWLDAPDDRRNGFLERAEVRDELNAAADRSVRHPAHRPRPGGVQVNNGFAFAFTLAGDDQAAMEQYEIIGDRVTTSPWQYLAAGPARGFLSLREQVREGVAARG